MTDKAEVPKSFNECYAILEKNAAILRDSAATPDIDKMVDLVTYSLEVYKSANERVQGVIDALGELFSTLKDDPSRTKE